ncbi:MAG: hypothetical protein LBS97_01255 [Treponema sp.]|nr:hypothetical protein [Treponema sp.]
MKQILVINFPDFLADFLKAKLAWEDIILESPMGNRDAYLPLISSMPDLVIISIADSIAEYDNFLQAKQQNLSVQKIPIFVLGPPLTQNMTAKLRQYGVVKYFSKPVKFTVFLNALGQFLGVPIALDPTPCGLQIRWTQSGILVSVTGGLNYDQIPLLRLWLSELLDAKRAQHQQKLQMIVQIRDFSFSFLDGVNIEMLLNSIASDPRLPPRNITLISGDAFLGALIAGHEAYNSITLCSELPKSASSLLESTPCFFSSFFL